MAVMQNLNAHAFIVAGMIRVLAGAETGAMAKYMTQFLWPQALGFIFIMAPAILAPQWSKVSCCGSRSAACRKVVTAPDTVSANRWA